MMTYWQKVLRLSLSYSRKWDVALEHIGIPLVVALLAPASPGAYLAVGILSFVARILCTAARVTMDSQGRIVILEEEIEDDEITF